MVGRAGHNQQSVVHFGPGSTGNRGETPLPNSGMMQKVAVGISLNVSTRVPRQNVFENFHISTTSKRVEINRTYICR